MELLVLSLLYIRLTSSLIFNKKKKKQCLLI